MDPDVRYRILEDPEPSRPPGQRRGRRWAVVGVTAVIAAGGLAAGASALGGGESAAPHKAAAKAHGADAMTADGIRMRRSGHVCMHGHGSRYGHRTMSQSSSARNY